MIALTSSRPGNNAKIKPLGPWVEQIPPKVARVLKQTMAANAKIASARTAASAGVRTEAGLGHRIEYWSWRLTKVNHKQAKNSSLLQKTKTKRLLPKFRELDKEDLKRKRKFQTSQESKLAKRNRWLQTPWVEDKFAFLKMPTTVSWLVMETLHPTKHQALCKCRRTKRQASKLKCRILFSRMTKCMKTTTILAQCTITTRAVEYQDRTQTWISSNKSRSRKPTFRRNTCQTRSSWAKA